MPRSRARWAVAVLALVLVGLTACEAPLSAPGEVSTITKVSSTTQDGWRYDFYRNTAYPCSISGYQTFLIATRVDLSPTATRPLWVYMHGGGVGYFSPDGVPRSAEGRPSEMFMREEGPEALRAELAKGDLMDRVRAEPTGFRMVAVSMCNRDIYGGDHTPDPNNPNTTPDGEPRTANGFFATKAAVQHVQDLYPTDDYFLHGTSAGSYGAYHVAWGLEQQGLPPTGIVPDSGVLNPLWNDAQVDGQNCAPPEAARAIIEERLHPDIGEPNNAPDLLVRSGRLTVPILQVWTRGDFLGCGEKPIACPLRDGSTPTMGSVDCQNELMRAAIAAQGPDSRSLGMRLCVDQPQTPAPCDMHVPTARRELNTDPAWPADFTLPIMDWVRARQADISEPPVPPGESPNERFVTASYVDFLGRRPTDAERDTASTALDDGSATRADVTSRLARSQARIGAIVEDLYQTSLGRPADPAGKEFWTGRIRSGDDTVASVAVNLYASEEHFRGPGEGDVRTWVGELYRSILGRDADPGGLDFWSQRAADGDRAGVALALFESLESRQRRVTALYQELLDRLPDAGGLEYWAEEIRSVGEIGLAINLASGMEYFERAQSRPL